jgi:NAD(P)-dependent dehydrogenase (short-subunit alcohol dehydrogenase family)
VPRTRAAYDALGYDGARHRLTVLPLELADLRGTRALAGEVVRLLDAGEGGGGFGGGAGVLDYLLLNAAIAGGDVGAEERGGFAGWKEAVVVNHFGGFLFLFLFLAA